MSQMIKFLKILPWWILIVGIILIGIRELSTTKDLFKEKHEHDNQFTKPYSYCLSNTVLSLAIPVYMR